MEDFTREELELVQSVLYDGEAKETQFSKIPAYGRLQRKLAVKIKNLNEQEQDE